MDLVPGQSKLKPDAIGSAMGREEDGSGLNVISAPRPASPGSVEPSNHIGIVYQIAKNGDRLPVGQLHRQLHRIAYPEAHAVLVCQPNFHDISPSPRSRRAGARPSW